MKFIFTKSPNLNKKKMWGGGGGGGGVGEWGEWEARVSELFLLRIHI